MSYYQQFLGGTSIYPIIINNNAQAGIQPALRLQNTNSGTIAQRIDMWNSNVSGKPTWTLISDWNQGGTNDLRFISAATDSTGVGVMTLLQNGNVGIGTANPVQPLDVNGNALIRGVIYAGVTNYSTTVLSEGGKIIFGGTYGDAGANGSGVDPTGGCIVNLFYATNEMSELVIFKGNDPFAGSGPDRIRLRGAMIVFDTYNSGQNGTVADYTTVGTRTTSMDQNGNWNFYGNVGIGQFSGTGSLTVNTQLNFTTFCNYGFGSSYMPSPGIIVQAFDTNGIYTYSGRLYLGAYGTGGAVGGIIQSTYTQGQTSGTGGYDANSSFLLINPKGGNVGIGTTNPGTIFQVWSGANSLLELAAGSSTYIRNPTSPIYIQAPASNITLDAWSVSAVANSTGGPGVYLGYSSWGSNSDIRTKTNIVPYTLPVLDRLNNIVVNQFKYMNHAQLTVTGFIAQNMKLYFPDIVNVSGADPNMYNLTEEDMKSGPLLGISSTDGMTPYLVKGIQELSAQVSIMQETIATLQTNNDELTNKIAIQQEQITLLMQQMASLLQK